MTKYLLYLCFCFWVGQSFAQKEFRFRNFSINDGLSQSSVTAIVQDENNSLWLGTQDGLNRFDGKQFEVFTADKTEGLESAYIKCAMLDQNGDIWFGTNNGLSVYSDETEVFSTFFAQEGEVIQIESFAQGEGNLIWIATSESGLYSFNKKTKKFKSYKGSIPSRKTTHVIVTEKGTIVVSTADKGVFLYEPKTGKVNRTVMKESGVSPVINRIVPYKENELLLATNDGIYSLNLLSRELKETFLELKKRAGKVVVVDIYQSHDLGWIIATNGQGIYVIYDNGEIHQSTEDIFQKTALLNNRTNQIFRDNAGFIWICSQRGLSVFDPSNKGILGVGPSGNEESGIPTPSVWSFSESASGRYIFIGTDNGVSKYDRQTGKFRQFYRKKDQSDISDEISVLSIEPISDDFLLVACTDGVFELKFSEGTYRYDKINYTSSEVALHHQRSYSIEHWKNTTYLIATKGGAIAYDVSTKKMEVFQHESNNSKKTISKGICRLVYKDNAGRIWFTTSTGGLNLLKENQGKISIEPYRYNSIIRKASKEYITSIYHAENGEYWMGTLGSGLLRWNEKTRKTTIYDQKEGLPNGVIYGVIRDKRGKFWLSTNKGLCQFDASKKLSRNFTEIHGLMSNEFNIGAYLMSSSGEMYFGGIYGYNFFNPSELSKPSAGVDVVFTKFKLDGDWLKPAPNTILTQPISDIPEIVLSYQKRSFTIRFQPTDVSHPELTNYKYVLEGSEEGDILLGTDNEIHFNALAPGSYVLRVYARQGDGPWSTYPARLTIHVTAPFWQRWWFWALITAALAIFIRWFVRRRIDSSQREQVRLEMKIHQRTREIQKKNEKIEQQSKKIEEEKNKVVSQQKLLQIEKDKTEKLLRNVIPESTAEELKKKGKARARAYTKVSVLFTDFVGFTKISDRMNPTELVKKLDVYFTKFDQIIVKNNLEKIKTIGDAYMCAGGVPVRNNTNPIDTCLAALEIQNYMEKRKNDAIANGREYWELRLGINTGEVTAGVIGSERLAYDIWGATVNQAQRMEMLGEPGKVTISGSTFNLIEPYFECTFKGKAQSKSRGLIDMYEVERVKPELSLKGAGLHPNDRFQQIVNLHLYSSINYYKAERHIIHLLEQGLSKNLRYHSIAHTKDVVAAVERIALLEGVTDEGLFLLKSAATYHDAGFIEQYEKNEPIGARLAEEILPKYGYTDKHIDRIKELIFVTAIPHQPKSQLEEIICDADLDYLGRDDFHEIADKLKRELMEHGKIESDRQWDEIQVKFLKSHKYFTKTAIKTRRKKKKQNLQEVIERLEKNEYEA